MMPGNLRIINLNGLTFEKNPKNLVAPKIFPSVAIQKKKKIHTTKSQNRNARGNKLWKFSDWKYDNITQKELHDKKIKMNPKVIFKTSLTQNYFGEQCIKIHPTDFQEMGLKKGCNRRRKKQISTIKCNFSHDMFRIKPRVPTIESAYGVQLNEIGFPEFLSLNFITPRK